MDILRTVEDLVKYRTDNLNHTIGFVPTMGNLHAGHLNLVTETAKQAQKVITSIFVNPTQFAPHEDFSNYPRTFEDDIAQLKTTTCDAVFYPSEATIYSCKESIKLEHKLNYYPEIAILSNCLCGQSRPHFFHGVVQVVCRLLELVQPHIACFGLKDYQQYLIIKKICSIIFPDLKIIQGKIIREENGLALSSRNTYLNDKNKQVAMLMYQSLMACRKKMQKSRNKNHWQDILRQTQLDLEKNTLQVEYLETRDRQTLNLVKQVQNARLFIACYVEKTRLIDNIALDEYND